MSDMLYNGIKLPVLPDTTLPYKVIVYYSTTSEYWFVPTATEYTVSEGGLMTAARADDGYLYDADTGSWISDKLSTLVTPSVKWANYDVLEGVSGTLYLSASSPIPVTSHNYKSLLKGLLIGSQIRL